MGAGKHRSLGGMGGGGSPLAGGMEGDGDSESRSSSPVARKRRNSLTCQSHAATVLHGGAACTEVHCGSGSFLFVCCLFCLISKQKGRVLVDSMHSHPSGGASKKSWLFMKMKLIIKKRKKLK